jgi:hypothetical protein
VVGLKHSSLFRKLSSKKVYKIVLLTLEKDALASIIFTIKVQYGWLTQILKIDDSIF